MNKKFIRAVHAAMTELAQAPKQRRSAIPYHHIAAVGLLACVHAGPAQAATVSYSASLAPTPLNWSNLLSLPQFNAALGTLTSVTLDYSGQIDSRVQVESLDAQPSQVTATVNANLTFGVPIGATLNIGASGVRDLSAFDGVIDFGGTSGTDFLMSGSNSSSLTLLAGLGGFIGGGLFNINVGATGVASASGPGNLISLITTNASAAVRVTYDYTVGGVPAPVPEPATVLLIGAGLLAATASRRRKQS